MKNKQENDSNKNTSTDYIKDYNSIMKDTTSPIITEKQWNKNGDNFVKFSLYGNYTPIKTSGSTSLIK